MRASSCYVNSVLADCESMTNPAPRYPLPPVLPALANSETVLVTVPAALPAAATHLLQVVLSNGNPPLSRLSNLLEAYSFDPLGNVKDLNYNFGQISWRGVGPVLDASLVNVNPTTQPIPSSLNTLGINIKHAVAVSTPLTTLRIAADHQWTFSSNSQVTAANNANYASSATPQLLLAPVLLAARVLAPNLVEVVLNESAVASREYVITITNLQNPAAPAAGNLKVYVS